MLYWGDEEYNDIPLRANRIEADGRLTELGSSELCGSSLLYGGIPLVAVNGWLLASGSTRAFGAKTVCSYEGPELAAREDLGMNAAATAATAIVPRAVLPLATEAAGGGATALVAMQIAGPKGSGPYEVRLYKMDGGGGLQLLDTVDGRGKLLFHPSGRFLYLSGAAGLRVFAIRAQSQLELVQSLAGSEGPMAVTLPF